MLKKLVRTLPAVFCIGGVLLMLSGVSMIGTTHTDEAMYPYILRAFAGLAVWFAALVAEQAIRDRENEEKE